MQPRNIGEVVHCPVPIQSERLPAVPLLQNAVERIKL